MLKRTVLLQGILRNKLLHETLSLLKAYRRGAEFGVFIQSPFVELQCTAYHGDSQRLTMTLISGAINMCPHWLKQALEQVWDGFLLCQQRRVGHRYVYTAGTHIASKGQTREDFSSCCRDGVMSGIDSNLCRVQTQASILSLIFK